MAKVTLTVNGKPVSARLKGARFLFSFCAIHWG
jgi:hypothetical protein